MNLKWIITMGTGIQIALFSVSLFLPACATAPGPSRSSTIETEATHRSQEPSAEKPSIETPRVVDFQPGIRIDYRIPQVEVAGEVILRKGELELFAYSKAPTPKQHETILLLQSKSDSIYQALGLIGLTPGRPMSYDWKTEKVQLPSGDPVDVLVRYLSDGRIVEESACAWMWDLERKRPMEKTQWLFAGSKRTEDGHFMANIDGTVVTVVNFDSAVLTLPASHSESNTALWLAANTKAIPPVGTKVTLILRPARVKNE